MVDVTGPVSFPCLKILYLRNVKYGNADSVRCLISGCLCLEELLMHAKIRLENMNISISTPTLNSLNLTLETVHPEPCGIKIELNAPALKYLNFSSSTIEPRRSFF